MATDKVNFSIDRKIHEFLYNRDQLYLGAIVFVIESSGGLQFSSDRNSGGLAHEVTWISPSTWYVSLSKGWVVPEEIVSRVSKAVEGLMTDVDVRKALFLTHNDVPLGQEYKTERKKRSRAARLSAAAERLDLASRLQTPSVRDVIFIHQEALVTYLLLTCFDLLGQPTPWRDFLSWLDCDEAHSLKPQISDHPIDIAKFYHSYWSSEYGVKNGFFNFIDNVLPRQSRKKLLDSFDVKFISNPPNLDEIHSDDEDKKKYLYKLRNEYTHQAKYFPGMYKIFPSAPGSTVMGREQTFTATKWIDFATRDWPSPLEEAIRQGIAARLRAILDLG